ncbi:hypothetical protein RYX36_032230 [Vicia faba]
MALTFYEKASSKRPMYAEAYCNMGVIYKNREAYNNLGVLYRDAGDIALANNAYEQRLKIDPDSRNAGQNRLLAMNYIDEGNDDKLFEAHRDWGRRFMRLYQPFTSWNNSKDPEGIPHYHWLHKSRGICRLLGFN